jgi:hypothetical protein
VIVDDKRETAPMFVSLKCDRKDGGYRLTSDVLSQKALRDELLRTALGELRAFKQRYERLKDLTEVFRAIDRVRKKVK